MASIPNLPIGTPIEEPTTLGNIDELDAVDIHRIARNRGYTPSPLTTPVLTPDMPEYYINELNRCVNNIVCSCRKRAEKGKFYAPVIVSSYAPMFFAQRKDLLRSKTGMYSFNKTDIMTKVAKMVFPSEYTMAREYSTMMFDNLVIFKLLQMGFQLVDTTTFQKQYNYRLPIINSNYTIHSYNRESNRSEPLLLFNNYDDPRLQTRVSNNNGVIGGIFSMDFFGDVTMSDGNFVVKYEELYDAYNYRFDFKSRHMDKVVEYVVITWVNDGPDANYKNIRNIAYENNLFVQKCNYMYDKYIKEVNKNILKQVENGFFEYVIFIDHFHPYIQNKLINCLRDKKYTVTHRKFTENDLNYNNIKYVKGGFFTSKHFTDGITKVYNDDFPFSASSINCEIPYYPASNHILHISWAVVDDPNVPIVPVIAPPIDTNVDVTKP